MIYAELVTYSRKVVSLVIGRSRKYRHTPRVPHLEVQQVHTRGEGKDGKLRMAAKQPSQSYYTTSLGFQIAICYEAYVVTVSPLYS